MKDKQKSKQERQAWWRGLTLEEQADYVEKVMRRQGKTPNRELVVKNLIEQGQYRKEKQYQITVTDEELDIIVTMLDMCCRSTQIIANDPKDPFSGLHEFERTLEERMTAKRIIQKIGRECL